MSDAGGGRVEPDRAVIPHPGRWRWILVAWPFAIAAVVAAIGAFGDGFATVGRGEWRLLLAVVLGPPLGAASVHHREALLLRSQGRYVSVDEHPAVTRTRRSFSRWRRTQVCVVSLVDAHDDTPIGTVVVEPADAQRLVEQAVVAVFGQVDRVGRVVLLAPDLEIWTKDFVPAR